MKQILKTILGVLFLLSVNSQAIAQNTHALPISIENSNQITEFLTLNGSPDSFQDVQFSPDGVSLGSLEINKYDSNQEGDLYIWDVPDFKNKNLIAMEQGKIRAYSFNLNNQTIVTGNNRGDIEIYYRISKAQMKVGEVSVPINRMAAAGQTTAIATGYLYDTLATSQDSQNAFAFLMWDLSNQTKLLLISKCNDEKQDCIGAGIATTFSADGHLYAFATNKEVIQVFDSESNTLRGSLADYDLGNSRTIVFAPDNKYIIYPATDGLRLWNLDSGSHGESGNDDYQVLIKQPDEGHITTASISPKGDVLAVGYSNSIIRLFNRESGEELALLKAHTQAIYSLSFSPDGAFLASGGLDGTVRLWGVKE